MEYNKKNLNGWALPEEMFEWILSNIAKGSTILELGSGRGTRELVKYYNVHSVEENIKWIGFEPKAEYIHAPLKSYSTNIKGSRGWYDEEILVSKLPKKYDLLIVDGPTGINRGNFVNFCSLFDSSVPILIDDTQRDVDRKMAHEVALKTGKKLTEFKGHEKEFIILT